MLMRNEIWDFLQNPLDWIWDFYMVKQDIIPKIESFLTFHEDLILDWG